MTVVVRLGFAVIVIADPLIAQRVRKVSGNGPGRDGTSCEAGVLKQTREKEERGASSSEYVCRERKKGPTKLRLTPRTEIDR